MRRVYSAENSLMAGYMMGLLEQAGIECMLRNDLLWGAMGQLPPTECWPEVWVCDDADYGRALALIEDARKPLPRSWPWTCACGERLEGQFTACWRCGRERPG